MNKKTLLAGLAVICAACQNVGNNDMSNLLAGQWTITEIDGKTLEDGQIPAEIEIDMENNRFSANAGCNSMNGSISIDSTSNNGILFKLQATTRMMCPDMENEVKLQQMFEKVSKYTIDTISLQKSVALMDVEGKILVKLQYLKDSSADEWSLKGNWKIQAVNGQMIENTESTTDLYFDLENNLLGGNIGCNNLGGGVNLSDYSISFSDLTCTMKMCDEHSMEVEASINEALAKVSQWSVANGELLLQDENGQLLLTLIRE